VPVLLKLHSAFGVDVQMFSEDEEARLIAELREALADVSATDPVSLAEIRELATNMPAVGRSLIGVNATHCHPGMCRTPRLHQCTGEQTPHCRHLA
jgi:hypothetical protein